MTSFEMKNGLHQSLALVCFLMLCIAQPVLAANLEIRRVIWPEHLPDNRVYGLAVDAAGHLWVSTLDGVVKWDGVSVEPVHSEWLRSLAWGRGRAWGVSRTGNLRTIPEINIRFPLSGQVTSVAVSDEYVWVGTEQGLYRGFSGKTPEWESVVDGPVRGLFVSSARVLFATDTAVRALDEDSLVSAELARGEVTVLGPSSGGSVVAVVDGFVWSELGGSLCRAPPAARSIFGGPSGKSWIGTDDGLWSCAGGVLRKELNRAVLAMASWGSTLLLGTSHGVRSLRLDQERYWGDVGVGSRVTAIETSESALWVGGWSGLVELDRLSGKLLRRVGALDGQRVMAVADEEGERLWAGTFEGELYKLNTGDLQPELVLDDLGGVLELAITAHRIWVATWSAGLIEMTREGEVVERHLVEMGKPIRSVSIGPGGRTLVAVGDEGVFEVMESGSRRVSPRTKARRIDWSGDTPWIGTESGFTPLARVEAGDRPGGHAAWSILRQGDCWLVGSDESVFRVCGESWQDLGVEMDGVPILGAAAQTAGAAYFGDDKGGVLRLPTGPGPGRNEAMPLAMTHWNAKVGEGEWLQFEAQEHGRIKLTIEEQALSFRFASAELEAAGGDLQYAYRVSATESTGDNGDWVEVGREGRIDLEGLEEGRYQLQVRGLGAGGRLATSSGRFEVDLPVGGPRRLVLPIVVLLCSAVLVLLVLHELTQRRRVSVLRSAWLDLRRKNDRDMFHGSLSAATRQAIETLSVVPKWWQVGRAQVTILVIGHRRRTRKAEGRLREELRDHLPRERPGTRWAGIETVGSWPSTLAAIVHEHDESYESPEELAEQTASALAGKWLVGFIAFEARCKVPVEELKELACGALAIASERKSGWAGLWLRADGTVEVQQENSEAVANVVHLHPRETP